MSVSVGGGVAVGGHADLLGGGGGHAPHPWGQTRPLGHGLGRAQGRRPGAPAGTLPAELAKRVQDESHFVQKGLSKLNKDFTDNLLHRL